MCIKGILCIVYGKFGDAKGFIYSLLLHVYSVSKG